MTFLFSKPKLPPVPAPEPKPEVTAEDEAALQEKQRRAELTRRGRRSTMLTGGSGIGDMPTVKRQTLGGY